ncbi:MAG: PEP-CTERM sorting domain-containing protein [bacterium]
MRYAWAVRPGDVGAAPVPEPATVMLLIFGMAGIIGIKKLGSAVDNLMI